MSLKLQQLERVEDNRPSNIIGDYSTILRPFNLSLRMDDLYYQVGEIKNTQGWVLHLSVVISQVPDLLKKVIPFLLAEQVPFKLAMTEPVVEDLLAGNLGLPKIGKVVCIFPSSDFQAIFLAKELINLTAPFKGPAVPTDMNLEGIVYTQYGDSYDVPFNLPAGVIWPFAEIRSALNTKAPNASTHLYRITDILKQDPRGNVFKGLYLKGPFTVKKCVIKQAICNMASDKEGRDIQDRLAWQYHLHNVLHESLPLPMVYELRKEEGCTILIMEYIKGITLAEILEEINSYSKAWQELSKSQKLRLVKYAIEISNIVAIMHGKGYVHRDIVPGNFLIDKHDKITLIDIELAYSLVNSKPTPPFTQGTPGFMSPEQKENTARPTTADDIYGLGATLIYTFTGILPVQIDANNLTNLSKTLNFMIGEQQLASTIASCLHSDPSLRPGVPQVREALQTYRGKLTSELNTTTRDQRHNKLNTHFLRQVISSALEGLVQSPIVTVNEVWYSKQITIENRTAKRAKQFSVSYGFDEGLTGILYVLARVKRAGIPIDACMTAFSNSWEILVHRYGEHLEDVPPSLYKGAAGFALLVKEGIESGLLQANEVNRARILSCLSLSNEGLSLADGIAGQGVSISRCRKYLSEEESASLLGKIVQQLLNKQRNDGTWLTSSDPKQKSTKIKFDLATDDTGIMWFLLDYVSTMPDREITAAVNKALQNMINSKPFKSEFYDQIASKSSYFLGDGGKGIVVLLIKAYETLHDEIYNKLATKALNKYPSTVLHPNFSQQNGLAALGELYVEAWAKLKNEQWKERAICIANVLAHNLSRNLDGSGHWVMDQNQAPTADFLTGSSGIIHFLARCLNDDQIGYRLLN